MEVKWIKLDKRNDRRGQLIISESKKNIPFDIKRVYCLVGMNDKPRGFHAHKELQQVMVCLAGKCNVVLDDGLSKFTVELNDLSDGLFIDKMVWHEMNNFSRNCILMVLASEWFNENDYIRDLNVFKKISEQ